MKYGHHASEVHAFRQRLAYSGDIHQVICRTLSVFGWTVYTSEPILFGLQDCNFKLTTDVGPFVVKIFASSRDDINVERYVEIMEFAVLSGVRHPKLYSNDGKHLFIDQQSGIRLVLMDYIEGQTFYEAERVPSLLELELICREAVSIGRMQICPTKLFDCWAVPNMAWMFEQTSIFMSLADRRLVERALRRFHALPWETLPTCFVHGDFTKQNTIVSTAGEVFILDFAVANIYPRIQELAVIAANLLHEGETNLKTRVELTLKAYLKAGGHLIESEVACLFDYSLAGIAMELMGSYYEKYVNKSNLAELNYWMQLGSSGLRAALENE